MALKCFKVLWVIDAEAETPEAAARQARAAQARRGTSAKVFHVLPGRRTRKGFGGDILTLSAIMSRADEVDLCEKL